MAEIIIDLSGRSGLADNFYGDADTITPRPELRISKSEDDLACGLFNPYLRNGYLAPTTTTAVSLTFDTAPTTILGSVEYDNTNDDVYWADRLKSIYTGSSLTDTSLSLVDTIDYSGEQYDELYDLQMYQINGKRKLFFVGKGAPFAYTPPQTIAIQDTADSYAAAFVSVMPAATTKPTVLGTYRNYDSAAGSSLTVSSVTVPTGSNLGMFVIAYCVDDIPTTVTYDGTSLTSVYGEGGSTGEPGIKIYSLPNPAVKTASVIVNFGASVTHRLVYVVVTDNTNQTSVIQAKANVARVGESTGIIESGMATTSAYDLTFYSIFSDSPYSISSNINIITEYYDGLITYGRESLSTTSTDAYGLQFGYSSLPATNLSATISTFSSKSSTPGAFIQALTANYAFMRVADNGFAYVFADNHVHKIDGNTTGGTAGTITKDVLLFPDGFTLTDAVDYRSRLYIAVHQNPVTIGTTSLSTYNGKCGIYVWNRVSTQLSSADYIELPGVREIKKIYASPDGQLKLIIISDSGLTELRQFGYNDSGGVVFPTIKILGIGAHPQFPDGLTIAADKAIWIANNGKMFSEKEQKITQLFEIKTAGTTTATAANNISTGALFYGSGDETGSSGFRSNKQAITFSYLDSTTNYIKKVYPFDLKTGANATQTPHQGDVYTGVSLIPMTSIVRQVRVYNAPVSGTGSTVIATVKLYFNQSSTAGMTKTITKDEAKRGYVDFKINKPYINAIQIEIEWATGITLDGDIYLPSLAIISHDETTTKSPENG